MRQGQDTKGAGRPDVLTIFGADGKPIAQELISDPKRKRPDKKLTLDANGQVTRSASTPTATARSTRARSSRAAWSREVWIDTKGKGIADQREIYKGGQRAALEADTNADRKVDVVQVFEGGQLARQDEDTNFDGVVDQRFEGGKPVAVPPGTKIAHAAARPARLRALLGVLDRALSGAALSVCARRPRFVREQPALALDAAARSRSALPSAPITRWQGTTSQIGFAPFAAPTARDAVGRAERARERAVARSSRRPGSRAAPPDAALERRAASVDLDTVECRRGRRRSTRASARDQLVGSPRAAVELDRAEPRARARARAPRQRSANASADARARASRAKRSVAERRVELRRARASSPRSCGAQALPERHRRVGAPGPERFGEPLGLRRR